MRSSSGLRALGVAGAIVLVIAACSDDPKNPVTAGADGGPLDEGGTLPGDDATTPPDPGVTCGAADVKPGLSTQSIMSGGSKRTYELFVPSTYDNHKSFALVFVF
ncbi:MAG: putative secreted protein, partial [Myxococcaceae bacterium]|nr:putative secreted protein [Myxococcaceae bacterium]